MWQRGRGWCCGGNSSIKCSVQKLLKFLKEKRHGQEGGIQPTVRELQHPNFLGCVRGHYYDWINCLLIKQTSDQFPAAQPREPGSGDEKIGVCAGQLLPGFDAVPEQRQFRILI